MSFGIVASVGGAIVGGMIAADGAKSAADAQAGAARDANALQERMFERQVELQRPWREAGNAGLNRLAYLLGLSPSGYGGSSSLPGGGLETADQIRARISGQYMKAGEAPQGSQSLVDASGRTFYYDENGAVVYPTSVQDEARLTAAIQAEMERQKKELAAFQRKNSATSKGDPLYGSLMDEFSLDDFNADPGYQFRKEEGERARMRMLSANGQLYSGHALKEMERFSQGLASQEFGTAFDRFNVNKTNQFNRLASIAGVGQAAANQTGAAAQNYGNAAAGNIIGAGNAMAAGRVGTANAINGAIGQGVSAYQQSNMLANNPGGFGGLQASFSQTPLGSSGFGTGLAYGNQDYGQFL